MTSTESCCRRPDDDDDDDYVCDPPRSNYRAPPNRRRRSTCPANERSNRTFCQIVERYLKDPFIVFFLAVIGIKICYHYASKLEWKKPPEPPAATK